MQTFLVRVWVPAAAEEDDERRPLRGVVEHVASRRRATFHGELDLLEFISRLPPGAPGGPATVVDKV